jgi:hypothetical protein
MSSPVLPDSCDVVLKDGSTVVFRPSTEADVQPVRAFFESLSIESQYQRFFGLPHLDDRRIRRLIAETSKSCASWTTASRRVSVEYASSAQALRRLEPKALRARRSF